MNLNNTNVYALSNLDTYENRSDDLDDLCLLILDQVTQVKAVDVTVESEDLENYTLPVSYFCETPLCKKVMKLKNDLGEMTKRGCLCVIRFLKASKLKSAEQYYFCLLQLHMSWRPESTLKYEEGTYESKYKEVENDIVNNVKRHKSFLDIDWEKLKSCSFLNSDDDSHNEEFSMLGPN